MSTAALALLAAVIALFVVSVVAAVLVRARRASEGRLDAALLVIGEQMDTLTQELAATVEKVREDAERARIVESLGRAIDLDEVLARCVEAAASLHGVSGAIVTARVNGVEHTAAAGLDAAPLGAIGAGAVGGPPDGSRVRAVGISYHYYPAEALERVGMRSAVAVPLESEQGQLGFLTVFGRTEDPPVAGADFQTLEAIVHHTAAALEAALQRQAQHPVDEGDPLTGLGNRTSLHETLALEVARAHRHRRRLAVCTVDVDDFGQVNAVRGQLAGDGVLDAIAELLRETIRPADRAFRSGGDEFTVILPDAGRIEGEALYARLQASLRPAGSPAPGISLSAGIAELKPDDDGVSLYERAERALQRAKAAGKGTAA